MADQIVTLKPTGASALTIQGALRLGPEVDWGESAVEVTLAEGPDVVGGIVSGRRRTTREASLPVQIDGRQLTSVGYLQLAHSLDLAVRELQRRGGTVVRQLVLRDGALSEPLEATVLNANLSPPESAWLEAHRSFAQVTLTLTYQPYWLGDEEQVAQVEASTATLIDLTVPTLRGNLPGPGKLRLKDNAGSPRRWVELGTSFDYYNPAAAFELRAAALSLSGANGALVTNAAAIGGQVIEMSPIWRGWMTVCFAYNLPHRGGYRIRVRAQGDSDDLVIRHRLLWRAGAGPWRLLQHEPVQDGAFRDYDLGAIWHTDEEATIDLRVDARASNFSATVPYRLNTITLIPTDTYAVARGGWVLQPPSVMLAVDDFSTVVDDAVLATRVAYQGGTWTETGATDIWKGRAADQSYWRRATSDTDTGRLALLGTATYAISFALIQARLLFTQTLAEKHAVMGVVTRYVDASNFAAAVMRIRRTSGGEYLCFLTFYKVVAGVTTIVAQRRVPGKHDGRFMEATIFVGVALDRYEVRFGAYEAVAGQFLAYRGSDAALSGALATGKLGVWHISQHNSEESQATFRRIIAFGADSPALPVDVVRANGLGFITNEEAYSAANDSSDPQTVKSYQGKRLWLPGGKSGRIAIKPRTGDPEVEGDTGAGTSTDVTLFHRPAFASLSNELQ